MLAGRSSLEFGPRRPPVGLHFPMQPFSVASVTASGQYFTRSSFSDRSEVPPSSECGHIFEGDTCMQLRCAYRVSSNTACGTSTYRKELRPQMGPAK